MFDTCPPLKHLMIAIPEYDGSTKAANNFGMYGAIMELLCAGIVPEPVQGLNCCYLDLVRNDLVRQFLESKADRLLFVDADVGFPGDAVLKVANTCKPVVAGVYPKKTEDAEWPVQFAQSYLKADPETGLVEAFRVATGFLCIHRRVFEALAQKPHVPWFIDDRNIGMHAFFQTSYQDGRFLGEDFFFCDLWRSVGGKIWIHPDIDFMHVGNYTWKGNYRNWFMTRPSWDKIEGFNNCPNLYERMVIEAEPGAHFVEVGTWKGKSAAFMAELIKASRKSIAFDVVDLFEGSMELQKDPDMQDGTLLQAFERNVAYIRDYIGAVHKGKSTEAASLYDDNSLDFVFLDADHDMRAVIADCLCWWPKVRPGGYLGGDDWTWDSVKAGVKAFFMDEALDGNFTLEEIDEGWLVRKP